MVNEGTSSLFEYYEFHGKTSEKEGGPLTPSPLFQRVSTEHRDLKNEWMVFVLSNIFLSMRFEYHPSDTVFLCIQETGTGGKMADELQIQKELIQDLLFRLSGKGKQGRETQSRRWRSALKTKTGGQTS